MAGLHLDRWLNLTQRPAFLRGIDPSEHIWWRPPETFALVIVTVAICGTLSTLIASLLNYWLVHGLMLAAELRLAGVRPLVLERQPQLRETAKANGFSGQITELLRYRGVLDRVLAASVGPIHKAPRLAFGEVYLDFSDLALFWHSFCEEL